MMNFVCRISIVIIFISTIEGCQKQNKTIQLQQIVVDGADLIFLREDNSTSTFKDWSFTITPTESAQGWNELEPEDFAKIYKKYTFFYKAWGTKEFNDSMRVKTQKTHDDLTTKEIMLKKLYPDLLFIEDSLLVLKTNYGEYKKFQRKKYKFLFEKNGLHTYYGQDYLHQFG